jgi:Domain of unknown function DUF1828
MVIIYIAIVLRHETDRRVLSDEGHTCSISPTKIDERDLHKGTRQKVITSALDAFTLEDRQGELVMPSSGRKIRRRALQFCSRTYQDRGRH